MKLTHYNDNRKYISRWFSH